jgi:sensor domain CHASE-containing protein
MGKYLNFIIAIVILVIVTAVCSNFFYRKGQEDAWTAAQQLVPLEKGELYLCVEETDVNGVSFLTVQEISTAAKDKSIDQRELRFRLNLALNGTNLKEYNNKYRGGKQGF